MLERKGLCHCLKHIFVIYAEVIQKIYGYLQKLYSYVTNSNAYLDNFINVRPKKLLSQITLFPI